ncbi:ABC transporter ATP-binding protein [Arthrobacter tecti]
MISVDLRSFAYDDGAGLADLKLTVRSGEHVLLAGASGSGKSSLARLLAGQFEAGQGQRFLGSLTVGDELLRFNGSESDPRIDAAAWGARVGYVGQNAYAQLSMVCATVGEEISFGLANRGVPVDEMRRLVSDTAERIGLTGLLDRDPRRLSGGELQRVCIASAVVGNPDVLVLDEPFKGLDAAGREEIWNVLVGLRGRGTAVLQFEPLLPDGYETLDHVIALADGTVVFDGRGSAVPTAGLRSRGIGTAEDGFVGPDYQCFPAAVEQVIEVDDVVFTYDDDVVLSVGSLKVRRGEAVALLGPNGSGKSTLLQHLNGLLKPSAGRVRIHGQDIARRTPGALAATVGYLFQDTDQQLFERTALREVAYGPRATGRSLKEAERLAFQALSDVGLADMVDAHPQDLCFRNRRLLALASVMATGPDIWALDEPTAGLDLRGRVLMAEMLRRHLRSGGTLVMATHDIAFAESTCSHVLKLSEGTAAGLRER